MVPLQKHDFLNHTRKTSQLLFSEGGHIGPPLHQCQSALKAFVGEHLCVLPQKTGEKIILEMILKTSILQCNHLNQLKV